MTDISICDSILFSPGQGQGQGQETGGPGADRLILFCSGRLNGYQVDRFSFRSWYEGQGINRLFIRDHFGLWYHAGLKGRTYGIADTAAYLRGFCDARGFSRITVVGMSSGAYAALLFGTLIGADTIQSFSPRTRLYPDAEDHAERDRHGVLGSLQELDQRADGEEEYRDLKDFFDVVPIEADSCTIHYDPENALDRFHAERLADVPGLTLTQHPGSGHSFAKKALGGRVL